MAKYTQPDNSDNVIDSRDIIARIEDLESMLDGEDDNPDYDDEREELKILQALADEAESSPDWDSGETLIREDHFTKYIGNLIDDCYPDIKEATGGQGWPYNWITIDLDGAADEAKSDYLEVDFSGVIYLIRA